MAALEPYDLKTRAGKLTLKTSDFIADVFPIRSTLAACPGTASRPGDLIRACWRRDLRVSTHLYNTVEDIDHFLDLVDGYLASR